MQPYLYFLLYFVSAVVYILFKTTFKEKAENILQARSIISYTNISSLLKGIPLLLAILFAYVLKTGESELYLGVIVALFFCLLGDFFIDKSLIQGMVMFSIAHMFFLFTFVYGISIHLVKFQPNDFIVLSSLTSLILMYDYVFLRYLLMLKVPQQYNAPLIIYTLLISSVLVSSIFLAYIVPVGQEALLPLGMILFVISDSLIAVREFSGKEMSHSVTMIMGSYYLAILLISLTTMFL